MKIPKKMQILAKRKKDNFFIDNFFITILFGGKGGGNMYFFNLWEGKFRFSDENLKKMLFLVK